MGYRVHIQNTALEDGATLWRVLITDPSDGTVTITREFVERPASVGGWLRTGPPAVVEQFVAKFWATMAQPQATAQVPAGTYTAEGFVPDGGRPMWPFSMQSSNRPTHGNPEPSYVIRLKDRDTLPVEVTRELRLTYTLYERATTNEDAIEKTKLDINRVTAVLGTAFGGQWSAKDDDGKSDPIVEWVG